MSEQLDRIERKIEALTKRMSVIETKVDEALFEDAPKPSGGKPAFYENTQTADQETNSIISKGLAVSYRRYDGEEADKLRQFIAYIRKNPNLFDQNELKYAAFADKDFEDLRISTHTFRILNGAFVKTYCKPMPFRFVDGTMYKYNNDRAWVWADNKRD